MYNQFKRLAIISDCVHMRDNDGKAVTENHIYCRQIQELAKHFEHTVIVCPFVEFTKESVTSVYSLSSIEFIELPNVGGSKVSDKWKLIRTIPVWIKAFRKANKISDIIFLRMPNNLSIPGFFYFKFKRVKTFAVYTGTWNNYPGEPLTYQFQKWLLKHFFKGPVWIYVNQEPQHRRLLKGFSPSYSEAEWIEETEQVALRIKQYKGSRIEKPVFITVGALVPNKNQQYILETCKRLHDHGFSFFWYIVGDGYMKSNYETFIKQNALEPYVCLAGKKTYTELRALYREANFLVQATHIEGFGKAPIEGMFHGVIPLLSKTAMSAEMTGNGKRGFIFDSTDVNSLEEVIKYAFNKNNDLGDLVFAGRDYVKTHTLENWSKDLIQQNNKFYCGK